MLTLSSRRLMFWDALTSDRPWEWVGGKQVLWNSDLTENEANLGHRDRSWNKSCYRTTEKRPPWAYRTGHMGQGRNRPHRDKASMDHTKQSHIGQASLDHTETRPRWTTQTMPHWARPHWTTQSRPPRAVHRAGLLRPQTGHIGPHGHDRPQTQGRPATWPC
jgi:hypothetical protein